MLSFYLQFLLLQQSYFLNYVEILFTYPYTMYFSFLVLTMINDMFYTNWFTMPTNSFIVTHTFSCRFPIVHPPPQNAHPYIEKMLTLHFIDYLLCEHNFCDPAQYHSQTSHKSVSSDYVLLIPVFICNDPHYRLLTFIWTTAHFSLYNCPIT